MRARVGSPMDVTGAFEKHWSNNDERVLLAFHLRNHFFMKSLVELKGDFEKAIGATGVNFLSHARGWIVVRFRVYQ